MKYIDKLKDDLKGMFSSPQTPASTKPSLDPRRISIAVLFVAITVGSGVLFGYLSHSASSRDDDGEGSGAEGAALQSIDDEGSLSITFKDSAAGVSERSQAIRATSGTLVRVRLLNTLETFDTVPVFAQIVDHSLGSSLYGWTLIGDASGDGESSRIKMSFRSARSPKGNFTRDLSGQALSLDGTLGVRAKKAENLTNRAFIGGGKAAAGEVVSGSMGASANLAQLLVKTLLRGLETEISSDLGSAYKNAVTLSLSSGQEFFIQLTENF